MRAVTYSAFGPADQVLKIRDLPTPDPAPDEVLVRLHRSGVNPSDVKMRAGGRPGVTRPPFDLMIPHSDGAGVIEAVGAGVDPGRVGQRVWVWNGGWQRAFGTAATHIALPAVQAVPLPDGISFDVGAVLGIPGLTAAHAVLGRGPVAGKTVLVSGGAGTVGHLAVQIAQAEGAQVIATARGDAGMQAAKDAGADHVLDYSDRDLATAIMRATDGAPVDHVVEVEFGRNAATIAEVIAPGGTIAAYGSAQDMAPVMPFYPLMFKNVSLDLVLVYLLDHATRSAAIRALGDLLVRDALNVRIAQVLDMDDCATAHDLVAQGGRAGAVLVRTH